MSDTSSAILFEATGGPEVLHLGEVTVHPPGPGEVEVRHTAIGLNYIDTYHRNGLYPVSSRPAIPGVEAAGAITAVGSGVEDLEVGQRVAYVHAQPGAYCQRRVLPAASMVKIPDDIEDGVAATLMVKGLTAQYLLRQTFAVAEGNTVLIHAAAGGMGSMLVSWASALGATVIGTAGTDVKVELARTHGCHHAINYTTEDWVARVGELTGGTGVDVVYDGVGRATFLGSLDSLCPRGLMVSYGQASGKIDPLDVGLLAAKGSLYVTRPTLFTYIREREALDAMATEVFGALRDGILPAVTPRIYRLADAATAHVDLESRTITGSAILLP